VRQVLGQCPLAGQPEQKPAQRLVVTLIENSQEASVLGFHEMAHQLAVVVGHGVLVVGLTAMRTNRAVRTPDAGLKDG
jgi:hypothetical protein